MSDKLETRGKTVKEAVSEALLQMGARRDEVEVTVLEEPKSGLFGFLGGRQAKVLVEKKSRRGGRRGGGDYRRKDKDAIAHELGSGSGSGRSRGRRGGRRNDKNDGRQDGRNDGRNDGRKDDRNDGRNDGRQDKPQGGQQKQEARGRGRGETEQKKEEGSSRRRRGRRGGRGRRGRRSPDEQANPNQNQNQNQNESRAPESREKDTGRNGKPQSDRNRRGDPGGDAGRDEGRSDRNRRSRRSRRPRRDEEQPAALAQPVEEINGNVEPEDAVEVDGNRIKETQDEASRRNSRSRRGSRGGRRRSRRNEDAGNGAEAREGNGLPDNRDERGDRNDRNDRNEGDNVRESYDIQPDEMIASGLKASQYAATVRDVAEDDLDEAIVSLATGMLVRAGFPCRCEVKDGEYRQVRIVTGDDSAGMLIGRHGSTVEAVEHLVERMSGMASGDRVKMNLDINNYRRRREESLAGRVDEAVARVRETERDHHMEPMNARERRLIHLEAAEHDGIRTYTLMSSGEKHVVIALDNGEGEDRGESAEESVPQVETEARLDVSVEESAPAEEAAEVETVEAAPEAEDQPAESAETNASDEADESDSARRD